MALRFRGPPAGVIRASVRLSHQGTSLPCSSRNRPVSEGFKRSMTSSMAATLFSGESGAPEPPMSVLTQPGEIAMQRKPSRFNSAATERA